MSMSAETKAFDTSMASVTGDLWLAALDPSVLGEVTPVLVNPGQTAVIDVTITPAGPAGTVVNGTLYVDSFTSATPPYGQLSGDELAAIPYSYTIGGSHGSGRHHPPR
jgi:hypothetical protein